MREQAIWQDGYKAGYREGYNDAKRVSYKEMGYDTDIRQKPLPKSKPKRKLSAWNKYVKANSKKPRFRYRNGKLNLKKMAIAFRKTPAGKKRKR